MHRARSCIKTLFVSFLALLICVPVANATTGKSSKTAHKTTTANSGTRHSNAASHATAHRSNVKKTSARSGKSSRSRMPRAKRVRGQQGIDNERAREIQEALIRANYLQGEPSGVWDQATKDAMTRYQKDNGWQNKIVPDSRALIKLGLGPNHQNVINPESSGLVPNGATAASPAAQLQPGGGASVSQ